jgi:hypothetical protein
MQELIIKIELLDSLIKKFQYYEDSSSQFIVNHLIEKKLYYEFELQKRENEVVELEVYGLMP